MTRLYLCLAALGALFAACATPAHAETPGRHVNVCYLLRTGSRVADIEYRLIADGYTREDAGALAGRMVRDHCPDQFHNVMQQVGFE